MRVGLLDADLCWGNHANGRRYGKTKGQLKNKNMIDEQVTAVMECEDLDNACTLCYNKETDAPKKEAALKMKGQFGYDEIIRLFGRAFYEEVKFGFDFLLTNKLKITITIEKAE